MPAATLLRAATAGGDPTRAFLHSFAGAFGVGHAFALSSGKAALAVALSALHQLGGRRKVVFPAYTCYSVPSAIVKAGLDPVPCDIAPGSFDYDYDQLRGLLGPDVLCALSVHLFGIPADTARLMNLCRRDGIFVVEDAAQAMDVPRDAAPLGTRADLGIFSLGRGKSITSGSGGLIVTSTDDIAGAIASRVDALPPNGVRDGLTAVAALAVQSVLLSPRLYWLPAGLPFLKLGETIFHEEFRVGRLAPRQVRLLDGWRDDLDRLNARRREIAAYYLRHVPAARDYARGTAYLRFPLLLAAGTRRRLLDDDRSRRLGISGMYPTSAGRIPQLQSRLRRRFFPEADHVARTLVTLPTHPLLGARDLARIRDLVNAATMLRRHAPWVMA
jgi:dTDP-4-amino-4,6-dideoxygalactose transaminase